jgi:chromosome segregation ATPase
MKKLLFLFAFVLLAAPTVTFAEDSGTIPNTPPPLPNTTGGPGHDRPVLKQEKEGMMNTIQEKRGEMHTNVQQFKAMQTNLQPTIQAEREAMKQQFQARRDEFKQKIATLKDEKKKTTAELVNTKLTSINQKRTDQMSQNLKKLQEILTKIKTKSDAAGAAGKDVSSVNAAITAAQTAIDNAKTAVAAQAAKDYTPQVTDTATLRQAMGTSAKQLESDLNAAHKTVVNAKTALYAAAKALVAITGGIMPTAVPTETTAPTETPAPTQVPVSPVPSQ